MPGPIGRPAAFGYRRIIVLHRPAARSQPRRYPGNIVLGRRVVRTGKVECSPTVDITYSYAGAYGAMIRNDRFCSPEVYLLNN